MIKKLWKAAPALVAALIGVALFFAGRDGRVWIPVVAVVAGFLFGWAARLYGLRQIPDRVTRAVPWIDGWIVGIIAMGATATLLVSVGGVWLEDLLTSDADKKNEYVKAVAGLASAGLTSFFAVVITKDLDDATGSFWPSALFKSAVQAKFVDKFKNSSTPWQAVWEDRLGAPNSDLSGWGLAARRKRAALIQAATEDDLQT